MLLHEGKSAPLRGGLGLRVSTLMGAKRIKLTGFRDTKVEELRSFGLFGEIISWRLWLFLPVEGQAGETVMMRLFALCPPLAASADA